MHNLSMKSLGVYTDWLASADLLWWLNNMLSHIKWLRHMKYDRLHNFSLQLNTPNTRESKHTTFKKMKHVKSWMEYRIGGNNYICGRGSRFLCAHWLLKLLMLCSCSVLYLQPPLEDQGYQLFLMTAIGGLHNECRNLRLWLLLSVMMCRFVVDVNKSLKFSLFRLEFRVQTWSKVCTIIMFYGSQYFV